MSLKFDRKFERKKIFVSAGDPSGDILGALVIKALKRKLPEGSCFFGFGGSRLQEAGVRLIEDQKNYQVMGFVEVAKNIAALRALEMNLLQAIDRERPDLAFFVDYPGLHFRLAEQLKLRGIPVIHYIAPKLWAWGRGRMEKLKRDFDLVLGILPFETEFFKGVPFKYVGNPNLDRMDCVKVEKKDFGFAADDILFAFLPGSREQEIRKMAPLMQRVARQIVASGVRCKILVPVAAHLDFDHVVESFGDTFELPFVFLRGMSAEAMKIADAALITSGTATLEGAYLGVPHVTVYDVDDLSLWIAERVVKIPYVSLVNIIAGKEVSREFIKQPSPAVIARCLVDLLHPPSSVAREFARIRAQSVFENGKTASENAADEVVRWLFP